MRRTGAARRGGAHEGQGEGRGGRGVWMGRRAACAAGEPGGDPWNLEVSTIGHDSRQFSPARYPPPVAQEHTRRLRKALYTHCWPATGHGAAAASWHVGLIVAACAGPLHARRHTDSTTAARRGRAPRPARIHSRCGTAAGSVQGRDFGPDNARYLRFTTAPSSRSTHRGRGAESSGGYVHCAQAARARASAQARNCAGRRCAPAERPQAGMGDSVATSQSSAYEQWPASSARCGAVSLAAGTPAAEPRRAIARPHAPRASVCRARGAAASARRCVPRHGLWRRPLLARRDVPARARMHHTHTPNTTHAVRSTSNAFPDVPGEGAAQPYDSMQSVRETLRRADEALKKANQPVCPWPRVCASCVRFCARVKPACTCARQGQAGASTSRRPSRQRHASVITCTLDCACQISAAPAHRCHRTGRFACARTGACLPPAITSAGRFVWGNVERAR